MKMSTLLKSLHGSFEGELEAREWESAWRYWFFHHLSPEEREEYPNCQKKEPTELEVKEGEYEVDMSDD